VVFLEVRAEREEVRNGDRLAVAGRFVRQLMDLPKHRLSPTMLALSPGQAHTSALPHCSLNGEVHSSLLSLTFQYARGVAEFFPGLIVMV